MDTAKTKTGGLLGTAAILSGIILLAKLLGLARDVLIAGAYGTTPAAIAFETASRLPILLFDLVIGGVVTAAFIPVFNDLLVKEGKPSAMRYAASYVNMITLVTGGLAALGVLFASPLVSLLAPDLSPEIHKTAVELTRILFPMIVSTGLAFSFVGILQSSGEFRIPALISLISNAIMVLYLLFFADTFGVTGLAVAMLAGWAAQVIVQIPALIKTGFRPSLKAGLFPPAVRQSLRMALPILIGTWTQPICSLINTRYASGLNAGRAITALGYANRLYVILVGVFSFVATNLLFPVFARAHAAGNREESRRMAVQSVKTLSFIIAPLSVGLAVLAEPIAALLYERGEFTPADTALTAEALRFYAVGMLFMAANEVLTKVFFAEKAPRIPMITALIALGANFGLVALLSPFGIGGIALASGLATALQCILNALLLSRRWKEMLPLADGLDLLRSLFSALLMGAGVFFIHPFLPGGRLLSTALAVLIGCILYAFFALLFRSEEIRFLTRKLSRK